MVSRPSTVIALVLPLLMVVAPVPAARAAPPVVLLHGLLRTRHSMDGLAEALAASGRRVVNLDYPSATHTIHELSRRIARELDGCCAADLARGVDFVTHSMGGILVRDLAASDPRLRIRRVVMLSPPNSGSELADALRDSALYKLVTGPAGQELGTDPGSVPNRLGPVHFELGVVAGGRSWNPFGSLVIPGDDDGAVAVARMRVAGMRDFIMVDAAHFMIPFDEEAIHEAVYFLEHGEFDRRARR